MRRAIASPNRWALARPEHALDVSAGRWDVMADLASAIRIGASSGPPLAAGRCRDPLTEVLRFAAEGLGDAMRDRRPVGDGDGEGHHPSDEGTDAAPRAVDDRRVADG